MREITSHKVNGLNEALKIEVLDEPGLGDACHNYRVSSVTPLLMHPIEINFQKNPIQEVGVNGISMEALLAIVVDRLEGFQSGEYACEENQHALDSVRSALIALKIRTRERCERGVEGTSVK